MTTPEPTVDPTVDVSLPRLLGARHVAGQILVPHAQKDRLVVSFRDTLSISASAIAEIVGVGTKYGTRRLYLVAASDEIVAEAQDVARENGWDGALSIGMPEPDPEPTPTVCGVVDESQRIAVGDEGYHPDQDVPTCNRAPHADRWHRETRGETIWSEWSGKPSAPGFMGPYWTNDEWRLIADALRGAASGVGANGPAGYKYVTGSAAVPAARLRDMAERLDESIADAQREWDA